MGKYTVKVFAQKDVWGHIDNNDNARDKFSLGIWQLIQVKLENKNLKLSKGDLYAQLPRGQCVIKKPKQPRTRILSTASLKKKVPLIGRKKGKGSLHEIFKGPTSFEFNGSTFKPTKRSDSSEATPKGDLVFTFTILTKKNNCLLKIANTQKGEVIKLKSTIKQKRKRPTKDIQKPEVKPEPKLKSEPELKLEPKQEQSPITLNKQQLKGEGVVIKSAKEVIEERNKMIASILTIFNKSPDNIKIIAIDMLGSESFYGKTSIRKYSREQLPLNKIRARRFSEAKENSRVRFHIVIYYMRFNESYIFLYDASNGCAYALKITGKQKQLEKIWMREMVLSIKNNHLTLNAKGALEIVLPLSQPQISEFISPITKAKTSPKTIDTSIWKAKGLGCREALKLELELPVTPTNAM